MIGILAAIKSYNFIRRLTEEAFSITEEPTSPTSPTSPISPFQQYLDIQLIKNSIVKNFSINIK
jgi:hypothetical protein